MSDKHPKIPKSNKCIDSEDEDTYRSIPNQSDVIIDANPNLNDQDQNINELQLPKKKSYENLINKHYISSLPQLPPMPKKSKQDENINPFNIVPQMEIPCETKMPIKSYTYFICNSRLISHNLEDRNTIMKVVKSILDESPMINYKTLQNDLKLRGNYCDPGNTDLDGLGGTTFSFVFQLFKLKENDKKIKGVFRRLCGDVVLYNNIYHDIVKKIRDSGCDIIE